VAELCGRRRGGESGGARAGGARARPVGPARRDCGAQRRTQRGECAVGLPRSVGVGGGSEAFVAALKAKGRDPVPRPSGASGHREFAIISSLALVVAHARCVQSPRALTGRAGRVVSAPARRTRACAMPDDDGEASDRMSEDECEVCARYPGLLSAWGLAQSLIIPFVSPVPAVLLGVFVVCAKLERQKRNVRDLAHRVTVMRR